jgi:hypothetical protein
MTEPRRLWRRYLVNNPAFMWLSLLQFCRARSTFDPAVSSDVQRSRSGRTHEIGSATEVAAPRRVGEYPQPPFVQ